tara:strand:- start:8371 stop:8733 length:363 start_codon:yes stop_codon:yes gene_type:complete
MNNLTIERAKVLKVYDVKVISPKFKIQEFVLEIEGKFPQPVKFQLTNERVDEFSIREGEYLTNVKFNLRGREWTPDEGEVKYFNSLDVWSAEIDQSAPETSGGLQDMKTTLDETKDDLPF